MELAIKDIKRHKGELPRSLCLVSRYRVMIRTVQLRTVHCAIVVVESTGHLTVVSKLKSACMWQGGPYCIDVPH